MSATTRDAGQPGAPQGDAQAFEPGHGRANNHAGQAAPASFVRGLCSTNHKDIGTIYLVLAVVAGIVGGALSMIMRAQLLHPGQPAVPNGPAWNGIVTQHGLIMIFFSVMPALIGGFGNWFIPLMIGAPDMAFPRLNLASLWMAVAGFFMTMLGLLWGEGLWGPVAAGVPFPGGPAAEFTLVALLFSGISSLLGAVNVITTIFNMRAPAMTLHRMPLFVWAQLVTAFLLVLAIPVLAAAITTLICGNHFATSFPGPNGSGDPALFRRLTWSFGHPGLYILILPGFGIVSHIVSTFSKRPIFCYLGMVYAMVAIGVVGFVLWAHHMFALGTPVDSRAYFMATTLVIAAPTGFMVFSWIATMWGGSIAFKTPMLWAAGLIFLLTAGGISGAVPGEASRGQSYTMVAHFHYVLSLGSVFAMFGGFYYWIGKMTGRRYPEMLGKLHFWMTFTGVNLVFFPQRVLGAANWNMVSSVGGALSGASMLVFLLVVAVIFSRKPTLGANYWGEGATTLEWSVASPAPHLTFEELR